MSVQLMCRLKLLRSIMLNIDDNDNENTFRDGGSTALEIAYTVYTVDTVHMAYTVDKVYTVEMVYTVDMGLRGLIGLGGLRSLRGSQD